MTCSHECYYDASWKMKKYYRRRDSKDWWMLKILDLYLGQGVLMKVLLFGSGTVILARKSFLHPHSPSNEMCLILEPAVKIEGSQDRERYEGLRDIAGGC